MILVNISKYKYFYFLIILSPQNLSNIFCFSWRRWRTKVEPGSVVERSAPSPWLIMEEVAPHRPPYCRPCRALLILVLSGPWTCLQAGHRHNSQSRSRCHAQRKIALRMNTLKHLFGRQPSLLRPRPDRRDSNYRLLPSPSNRRLASARTRPASARHALLLCAPIVGGVDVSRVNSLGRSLKSGCVTTLISYRRTVSSTMHRVCVVSKDCFTIAANRMVNRVALMPLVGVTLTRESPDGVASLPSPVSYHVCGYIGRLEVANEWWRRVMHVTRELVAGVGLLCLRLKNVCWIPVRSFKSVDCPCVPILTY